MDDQPLKRTKHAVIGVYADPGVGKTDLIGSCQHLGKTLIIRPPQDHTDSILDPGPNLTERVIQDWDTMNTTMDELRHEGDKYDFVVVDSWSLLQDTLLDDIWDGVITKKPHRYEFGLDQSEYGVNFLREGIWMRHVIGADLFHLIWTAHPMMLDSPDKDEDGDPVKKLMPWVQGKQMSQKFCGYSKMVLWLEKSRKEGSNKRILRATSDDVHYAKDQYDAIPEKGLVIPRGQGMPKVMELIYKSRPHLRGGKQRRARRARRTTRKGRS